MLPTPNDLRELSQRFLRAVRIAADIEVKRRLAAHALTLAQAAEQIMRDGQEVAFVEQANFEQYKHLLREALDERTLALVETLLNEEKPATNTKLSNVQAWRIRAEELRATAEQFTIPSAQEALHRAATNYDALAEHAEAQLGARPPTPAGKIG